MSSDKMVVEMPSDEDIFAAAEADDAEVEESTEAVQADEAPEAEAEQTQETQEDPKTETEEQAPPEPEGEGHQVPIKYMLEERQRAQEAEKQLALMQQQWQAFQQNQAQQQTQQQQEPEPEHPSIFEDPKYYQDIVTNLPAMLQQEVQRQTAMVRREVQGDLSLARAKENDPETFNAAWNEMARRYQSGDRSWQHEVLRSDDPGGTLLQMYSNHRVTSEVGDNPEAYLMARIDQLKEDPEFRAYVLGDQAQAETPQEPDVRMPPSLNTAGSLSNPVRLSMSQEQMWKDMHQDENF